MHELRWAFLHALGTALADQEQTDSFQQIGRGIHSAGEEDVGLRFVIVDADLARNENGRSVGREILDGGDQLRAIETGHGHVGDYEVDAALLKAFKSVFATGVAGYAVAAGLEHDFAIRKGLFIVVNTKDRALGFHPPPASASCRL